MGGLGRGWDGWRQTSDEWRFLWWCWLGGVCSFSFGFGLGLGPRSQARKQVFWPGVGSPLHHKTACVPACLPASHVVLWAWGELGVSARCERACCAPPPPPPPVGWRPLLVQQGGTACARPSWVGVWVCGGVFSGSGGCRHTCIVVDDIPVERMIGDVLWVVILEIAMAVPTARQRGTPREPRGQAGGQAGKGTDEHALEMRQAKAKGGGSASWPSTDVCCAQRDARRAVPLHAVVQQGLAWAWVRGWAGVWVPCFFPGWLAGWLALAGCVCTLASRVLACPLAWLALCSTLPSTWAWAWAWHHHRLWNVWAWVWQICTTQNMAQDEEWSAWLGGEWVGVGVGVGVGVWVRQGRAAG